MVIAGAGALSFAATFGFVWITRETAPIQVPSAKQPAPPSQGDQMLTPEFDIASAGDIAAVDAKLKKALTEKQLKNLVYEMRERIRNYDSKLNELEIREQRIQTTQNILNKDIEELNNLRIELASIMTGIKNEQDKLQKSVVRISETEKTNLASLAAMYDKMKPASASKIIINISQTQNENADDAVKILHYMTDRTRAKLIAAVSESEPKLAAFLSLKLKRISEKE